MKLFKNVMNNIDDLDFIYFLTCNYYNYFFKFKLISKILLGFTEKNLCAGHWHRVNLVFTLHVGTLNNIDTHLF